MSDEHVSLGAPRVFVCPCGEAVHTYEGTSYARNRNHSELCLRCAKAEVKRPGYGAKEHPTAAPTEELMPPKKPRKRARQTELKGMEKPRFPAIEKAAEVYRDLRDERKNLGEREARAKELLIIAMQKHGQTRYRDDNADPPFEISLSVEDKVKLEKVRRPPQTELERSMEQIGMAAAKVLRRDVETDEEAAEALRG